MFFRIWNGIISDGEPEYAAQLVRVIEKSEISLVECINPSGKPELKYVLWKNLTLYDPLENKHAVSQ
jgi:hypothetical protein